MQVLCASSLERWGDTTEDDLKLDISIGSYPPKFNLHIMQKKLTTNESIDVCVRFKGICKVVPNGEEVVDHILVSGKYIKFT